MDLERTEDGHYVVIEGRRWRATDPDVPEDVAAVLRSELMSARRAVGAALRSGDEDAEKAARARVHRTKTALGERGTPWWEQTLEQRRQRWEAGLPAEGSDQRPTSCGPPATSPSAAPRSPDTSAGPR